MVLHLWPWELQDPTRRLQRIAESLGVAVPHASICPSDAVTRMCREANLDVPPYLQSSPQVLANAIVGGELAESGGGGDDRPAWVPADAVIHIDFVGERAWSNGSEVAIDTLLGSDPNTEGWAGPTSYDAGNLTVDGYLSNDAFAFIGAAKTLLLEGATGRIQFVNMIADFPSAVITYQSAEGGAAIEADIGSQFSADGEMGFHVDDAAFSNGAAGGLNILAFTMTPSRGEFSLNGRTALAGDTTAEFTDEALAAVSVDTNADTVCQSITLYDPLPDTTELSGLSEVG